MARNPLPRSNFGTASLVERRDSLPDVELEEGLSADVDIQDESIIQAPGLDIELEEDGGVVINFDPSDISPGSSDFHANLAEDLSDRAASRISSDLIEQYESNKLGRKDWEEAYTTGLELLGFRYEDRSQPFRGATGVTHPLLAEAVTQFQAQAFSELLPSGGPVRTQVMGKPTPEIEEQSERVREYMNYQITCVMKEYTPEFDQMLFYLPLTASQSDPSSIKDEMDEIAGIEPAYLDTAVTLLECHVNLDIEGFEDVDEDNEPTGLKLPYIVTISEESGKLLSVRRNYDEDDSSRKKKQYFVHFKFLPGFGFYGLGLIHMIGGLSRTATAALRQLIDAGTLANLPAGFKARGLRIRNDDEPLSPGEFRDVDAPGGAIRDSLMLLPYKGADQTLFQLMGFCVEAGQRFAAVSNLQVGDGNQQAAVGTTIAMLEQGAKVMSAIHKRLHYAQKDEFQLLASVFSEYLPPEYPYDVVGGERTIKSEDFDARIDVVPVSDPNIFSMAQRVTLAQTELQLAQAAPDLHNLHEAFRRMYRALGVKDVDSILKPVDQGEPTPKDPATENSDALDSLPLVAFQKQNHAAHIMSHLSFGTSGTVSQMPPIAVALQKHVLEHVSLNAKEQVMAQMVQQLQGRAPSEEDSVQIESMVAEAVAQGMQELKQISAQLAGGDQPDPLIALKEKDLQLQAQRDAADSQIDQSRLALDQQKAETNARLGAERIQSSEEIVQARIQAAREREMMKQQN